MDILHVSMGMPPFRTGGLNQYCLDLMREQQKQGENVSLIFPGPFSLGKTHIKRKKHKLFDLYQIINPLPLALSCGVNEPKRYYAKCKGKSYEQFFRNKHFDVIHVHSFMGIHLEFFKIAKQKHIRLVFTTHDYYPFCLKCNFLNSEEQLCLEPSGESCYVCNKGKGFSVYQEILLQSRLYQVFKTTSLIKRFRSKAKKKKINSSNSLSKKGDKKKELDYKNLLSYNFEIIKNFDCIHCNSEVSKKIYQKFHLEGNYKVIPITKNDLPQKVPYRPKKNLINKKNPIKIGFIGTVDPIKGLDILIKSLHLLDEKERSEWELHLYGDDFKDYEHLDWRINSHGRFLPQNISIVFEKIDILVVPSICYETFGLVVIEALSYGNPVIISDRVGAGLLVNEISEQMIYKESEGEFGLYKKIEEFMSVEFYNNILRKIRINFKTKTFNEHYEEIKKYIYKEKKYAVKNC